MGRGLWPGGKVNEPNLAGSSRQTEADTNSRISGGHWNGCPNESSHLLEVWPSSENRRNPGSDRAVNRFCLEKSVPPDQHSTTRPPSPADICFESVVWLRKLGIRCAGQSAGSLRELPEHRLPHRGKARRGFRQREQLVRKPAGGYLAAKGASKQVVG